jgi:hypothetical protein
MVTITRKSPFTGQLNTMHINIGEAEFRAGMVAKINGMNVQDAFPTLDADEREFIMTGITPQEWADSFGSEES